MMSVDASLEEFADTFEHAFEHVILHALTIRICGVIGNASKRLIINSMKATRACGIFVARVQSCQQKKLAKVEIGKHSGWSGKQLVSSVNAYTNRKPNANPNPK